MVSPRLSFTLGEAPSTTRAVLRVRAPSWAYGAAASVAVFLFALVLSGDLSGFLAEDISAPAALPMAETETEKDTTTPAETESVKAAPAAISTAPSANGARSAVPDIDQQMAAAAMEAAAPPPVAPPDPSSALVEPEEPLAVAESPLQPSAPSEPERAAASSPPTEADETLTVPPAKAADGGTAPVWRVLEGVFGGVALLLVGLAVWRMRRLRRRITS